MSDDNKTSKKRRVVGVASGIQEYTTKHDPRTFPTSPHDFTLSDFLIILRKLLADLNINKFEDLVKMISDHVHSTGNVHKVTIEQLGTDVLQELYKLWLSLGNEGTEDQFTKILFQYIQVADLQTTLEGESRDRVPSVYATAESIKRHDTDPKAHDNLFRRYMPGGPITVDPALSILGYCGMPTFVKVERDSPIYYINSNGHIGKSGPDTLPNDYTFGRGAYPIFGEVEGLFSNNADIRNISPGFTAENVSIEYEDAIWPDLTVDEYSSIMILTDTKDISSTEHAILCDTDIELKAGETCTLSYFVKDLREAKHSSIGIRIFGLGDDEHSFVHYNLNEMVVYQNFEFDSDILTGGVSELCNGYYRIWCTFTPPEDIVFKTKLSLLDIVDGDFGYIGKGEETLCVMYPQLTKTDIVTPPLISTDDKNPVLAPTYISVNTEDLYLERFNPIEGAFHYEVTIPIGEVLDNPRTLFELSDRDQPNHAVLSNRLPSTYRGRVYAAYSGEMGASVGDTYIPLNTEYLMNHVVHSYSPNEQVFGSTKQSGMVSKHDGAISSKGGHIFIGCDRYKSKNTILNGYLKTFVYYPKKLDAVQVDSLTGEKDD